MTHFAVVESAFEIIHTEDPEHKEEKQRNNEDIEDIGDAHDQWLNSQSHPFIPWDYS